MFTFIENCRCMLKKVTEFLLTRENLIIFILFLLFCPARTQTFNLIYIISDYLFTNGDLTEVYSYNYHGKLLGCEEVLQMKAKELDYNWLQKYSLFLVRTLFFLVTFVLLFRKKVRSGFSFWLLVVIACFPILTAIVDLQLLLSHGSRWSINTLWFMGISTAIYLSIGFYIFFRILSFKQRLQVPFVAFPGFVVSFIIWYKFLGPLVLPMVD